MSTAATEAPRANVLVVEDSAVFREMQGLLLRQAGYGVSGHEHPHTALAAARELKYDLVIIDYELPEMNGQQFMHELRKILPDIAVIFVSGSLTLELAIQLGHQGVAGIFNKPANPKLLLEKINETITRTGSRDAALPGAVSSSPLPAARRGSSNPPFPPAPTATVDPTAADLAYAPHYFLGRCEAFREFTHRLWKVRDFRAVLLLQGEAGTPFELIARDLAAISIFRHGPTMVCDAAQFESPHLIEVLAPSLLSQDAGTLIITGVESLTLDQQKTLETLMTSREMFLPFARRFRLVLASAGHLSDLADVGSFGETLFYKISSLSVEVPPLRELREDVLLHARHLLDQHAVAGKLAKSPPVSTEAARWLETQEWAGNYTELSRTLELAVLATKGRELDVDTLSTALERTVAERDAATARATLADTPAPATEPVAIDETVPPFAMLQPRPTPVAPAPALSAIAPPAPSPAPVRPSQNVPAVAAAPVTPPPPPRPSGLTGRSVFRPAAGGYDFSRRLAEALAMAEAGPAA